MWGREGLCVGTKIGAKEPLSVTEVFPLNPLSHLVRASFKPPNKRIEETVKWKRTRERTKRTVMGTRPRSRVQKLSTDYPLESVPDRAPG